MKRGHVGVCAGVVLSASKPIKRDTHTSAPDASSWESGVTAMHTTASSWPLRKAMRCAVGGMVVVEVRAWGCGGGGHGNRLSRGGAWLVLPG